MNNDEILKYCDEVLEQPLLTQDGFLNPACLNELYSAIKNMPKTYDRLSSDPEWSTPRITHWRDIVGALSLWAIRNIPDYYRDRETMEEVWVSNAPVFPPGLEKILGFLGSSIRSQFDKTGYAELSLCDISRMLYDILYNQQISVFNDWNNDEVMGPHWLDLDALLHCVCITIRDERRDNDRFDKKFIEKYGSE